jgi:hypothetical protein
MNREEILKMPAGREMDLLVCRHVMGIEARCTVIEYQGKEVVNKKYTATINHELVDMPYYSTEIESAWNVVGKKDIDGWSCVVENLRGYWQCTFAKVGNTGAYCSEKLAPLAICKAALLTVVPVTEGGV